MWDLLFVLSFLINVGLILYFLKPELLPKKKALKRTKEQVVGYYDDTNGPVSIKKADSFDYTSVFDGKGWRNLIGFKSKGETTSDEMS